MEELYKTHNDDEGLESLDSHVYKEILKKEFENKSSIYKTDEFIHEIEKNLLVIEYMITYKTYVKEDNTEEQKIIQEFYDKLQDYYDLLYKELMICYDYRELYKPDTSVFSKISLETLLDIDLMTDSSPNTKFKNEYFKMLKDSLIIGRLTYLENLLKRIQNIINTFANLSED